MIVQQIDTLRKPLLTPTLKSKGKWSSNDGPKIFLKKNGTKPFHNDVL